MEDKIASSDHCGGPLGCRGRKYDHEKEDCKECLRDATEAMIEDDKNHEAEMLLDKHCRMHMIEWNLQSFKRSHPKLLRSILGAIKESRSK